MMKFLFEFLILLVLWNELECTKKLGVFWGANLAWERDHENSLLSYCNRNTYDIIILTTLVQNGKTGNKDDLPSMNFANHCNDNKATIKAGYYSYLRCPSIERHIRQCQSKGIKILLDLGSGVHHIGFSSVEDAKKFAKQVWDLFLGGSYRFRTFGSVVLNGINLSLRKSDNLYMVDFVKELKRLLVDPSNDKTYLLTAAPSCFLPNRIFGETFEKIPTAFDSIYVNFGDQSCDINQEGKFLNGLVTWITTMGFEGPNIFVGLPAGNEQKHYGDRKTVKKIINNVLNQKMYKDLIGGIILYEASWDDLNVASDGKRYSQFIREVFDGKNPIAPAEGVDTSNPGPNSSGNNNPNSGHRPGSGARPAPGQGAGPRPNSGTGSGILVLNTSPKFSFNFIILVSCAITSLFAVMLK